MLSVQSISKSFGVEPVLQGVTFTVNAGERLALIGPNGCGKTTLLRILAGEDRADAGVLRRNPPDLRTGYLPQGLVPAPEDTIGGFLGLSTDGTAQEAAGVERAAVALAHAPGHAHLQQAYDAALARLLLAEDAARRAPEVLGTLGLAEFSLDAPIAILSGGQKTRLALARVLLGDPQLLLLDEPTNHLDLAVLAWLEQWLESYRGAALFVSHDRAFLDRVATGTLELDPLTHAVRQYAGNYSDYLEQKLAERERQRQAYQDQQAELAQLRGAAAHLRGIARFRVGGKADTGDKFARGFFANRGKGTVGRAKHIERRIEQLLKEDHVEKPRSSWQMRLDFGEPPASGRDVVWLEDLAVGYGERALLSGLRLGLRYGARAVLIGPNGTGKTTLLRTIAGLLSPLAGAVRLGANVRPGYMRQEQEDLDPALDALSTIRRLAPLGETDARAFLHQFLFTGDDVFVPIASLSYGERARLSLACLVARGCNLLLLDEPINHLDIPARARFEQALEAFEGTVLAVVHDRYFIEGFATEVWEAAGGAITVTPISLPPS